MQGSSGTGSDPHVVTSEPEAIVNEWGEVEYIKPNVGVFSTSDTSLNVSISVQVDVSSLKEDSTLLKFMRFQILQCTNEDLAAGIDSGQIRFISEEYGMHAPPSEYKLFDVLGSTGEMQREFKTSFTISKSPPKYLKYYASCYIDKVAWENEYGAPITGRNLSMLYGRISRKRVYENSELVTNVEVLVHSNGSSYSGSTHIDLNGRTRTGAKISDMLMKVDIKKLLQNWTIRDAATTAGGYYQDLLAVYNSGTDLLREMARLLSQWTQRDAKTISGRYYIQLKSVYDYYAAVSLSEAILQSKMVPNFGVKLNQNSCYAFEHLCDIDRTSTLTDAEKEQVAKLDDDRYFTQLLVTTGEGENDASGPAKLFFSLDCANIFRNNISYSCLLYNSNGQILSEMLKYIKIRTIEVSREEDFNPSATSNDFGPPKYVVAGTSLASDAALFGQTKDANNIVQATIREIQNVTTSEATLPTFGEVELNPDYKHYTVFDNYTNGLVQGNFRYSVTLTIEDNILDFVRERLSNLSAAINSLIGYSSLANLKCAYSSKEGKFTQEFRLQRYKESNPQTAAWLICPTIYADILRSLYNIDDQTAFDIAASLYMKLDPNLASPEEIDSVIKDFQALELDIRNRFNVKNSSDNNAASKATTKSISRLIEVKHVFSSEQELLDVSGLQYTTGDSTETEFTRELGQQSLGMQSTTQKAFGVGTGNQGLTGGQGAGGAAGLAFGSGIQNVNVKG